VEPCSRDYVHVFNNYDPAERVTAAERITAARNHRDEQDERIQAPTQAEYLRRMEFAATDRSFVASSLTSTDPEPPGDCWTRSGQAAGQNRL
jgi:hypothetical protein